MDAWNVENKSTRWSAFDIAIPTRNSNSSPNSWHGADGLVSLPRDIPSQREDLLISDLTHFRPIEDNEIEFADGTSFTIDDVIPAITFMRSESGRLYRPGSNTPYFEYHHWKSNGLQLNEIFPLKFRACNNDQTTQTDFETNGIIIDPPDSVEQNEETNPNEHLCNIENAASVRQNEDNLLNIDLNQFKFLDDSEAENTPSNEPPISETPVRRVQKCKRRLTFDSSENALPISSDPIHRKIMDAEDAELFADIAKATNSWFEQSISLSEDSPSVEENMSSKRRYYSILKTERSTSPDFSSLMARMPPRSLFPPTSREGSPIPSDDLPLVQEKAPLVPDDLLSLEENSPFAVNDLPLVQKNASLTPDDLLSLEENATLTSDDLFSLKENAPLTLDLLSLKEKAPLTSDDFLLVQENAPLTPDDLPSLEENTPSPPHIFSILKKRPPTPAQYPPNLEESTPLMESGNQKGRKSNCASNFCMMHSSLATHADSPQSSQSSLYINYCDMQLAAR